LAAMCQRDAEAAERQHRGQVIHVGKLFCGAMTLRSPRSQENGQLLASAKQS
jgi:hypothetical protein